MYDTKKRSQNRIGLLAPGAPIALKLVHRCLANSLYFMRVPDFVKNWFTFLNMAPENKNKKIGRQ